MWHWIFFRDIWEEWNRAQDCLLFVQWWHWRGDDADHVLMAHCAIKRCFKPLISHSGLGHRCNQLKWVWKMWFAVCWCLNHPVCCAKPSLELVTNWEDEWHFLSMGGICNHPRCSHHHQLWLMRCFHQLVSIFEVLSLFEIFVPNARIKRKLKRKTEKENWKGPIFGPFRAKTKRDVLTNQSAAIKN